MLSPLFRAAVGVRNTLYDWGWLKSSNLPVKVISVGNISVGGTGKTSFVIWLMRELVRRGHSVGVVSRGYKGQVQGVSPVPIQGDPKRFGDEPCLIANECLGPVFVGADRVQAGLELLKNHKVDFLIADDAFQHRRLQRHTDVVLLDLSAPFKDWALLPSGRLRENLSALKRAQVLVKTKRSLSRDSSIEDQFPSGKLLLEMDYGLDGFKNLDGKPKDLGTTSALLVSGVARPEGVEILAKRHFNVVDHMIFADHHLYTEQDVLSILQQMSELGLSRVVTTAKDGVKFAVYPELKDHLLVMNLSFKVSGDVDEFFQALKN